MQAIAEQIDGHDHTFESTPWVSPAGEPEVEYRFQFCDCGQYKVEKKKPLCLK